MKQKSNGNRTAACEPVLDFISGNSDTEVSKRLTKHIGSLQTLWQLAKMSRIVKNTAGNEKKTE